MFPHDPSRRRFIKRTATWATMVGLAPILGTCESCQERLAKRPIRKSLATLDPNDPIIQTYRDAVAQMKALPASDGRSWQRQAQIHLDHCPHGNWFFLPWHRAYLSYFENICRELTGNNDFALPYWDWTADAHVPAPFWGNASNALFHAGRTATASSTANAGFVGRPEIDSILGETDFLVFASGIATAQRQNVGYGRLEGTPHNYVHGFVGGDMGTYLSPLDPIFWMHHNMIECLWVDWNVVRGNANTNDSRWTDFQFTANFFDRAGAPVDITVAATALFPVFSYQFDGACGGSAGAERMADALSDTAALRTHLREGGPARLQVRQRFAVERGFQLTPRATTRIPLPPEAVAGVVGRADTERLLLRVEEIVQPRSESFYVRVFVNLPTATAETPIQDPHYAGSFAFFNDPRHRPDNAGGFVVDVTETIRRLATAGAMDAVEVQLVAVPMHPQRPAVTDSFAARRLALELARVLDRQQ